MKKYRDFDLEKPISDYDLANLFTVNVDDFNNLYFNISRGITFTGIENPQKNMVVKYQTIPSDTWHLISYKYYGTVKLWWILCKINGIIDPMMEPMPDVINVLSKKIVSAILSEIKIQ